MKAEFTVPGEVCAKGRPRFVNRGRFVQTYTPDKTVNYENLVRLSFMQAGCEKLSGAIKAEIKVFMQIPKSESMKKKAAMMAGQIRPTKKPDADNCAKSVLDALNKIAFDDDSQIVELHVNKYYSENPRVTITLEEI